MWDQRFADSEFFYGTDANDFLKENIHLLSGKVLSLAEGEGRNAVFMAQHGLKVLGVDSSQVGLEKAQQLAKEKAVSIETQQVDLAVYSAEENSFDAVVSIFAHLPVAIRKELHKKVELALKPGGIILLEGYSKAQIDKDTGGPKNLEMLYALEEIISEFPHCKILHAKTLEREVIEGIGHTGLASVVQLIARKL